ncbi:outer membrane lipoprotein LolB [Duganella sp. FT80W]|uniref:Outer-membrane lipoprotein LolB n=1 Tax=Duganella guangzhouensis TaxID=2666084 RepID=A0A6I2LBT9_9BURK|nr:outer membrane lipoprotein LolB [Duganella guangzhouensis]MRW93729.1 outer membrane lipoprotein LolB [Duganella guangzhouensis]
MIRPLLIALALSTVAGCTTTPSVPRSSAAVAPYRDSADFGGRIAINYSRDGKKESLNGTFTWRQGKTNTDVSLISPTGQTVAVINVTPQSATLTESGKAPKTAPDLDTLTTQALGWSLPVSGLRDWLQGYATDSKGQRFTASPANDNVITRDGWKLEYVSWQDDAAPVPQPKRIDVTRIALGQAVDDMQIRIVIYPPEK